MNMIAGFVQRRYEGYLAHHQTGKKMFRYMGALGIIAYPSLWVLRLFKSGPVYDDLWLRGISVCLSIMLLDVGWPEKLKPYYMPFSYAALTFMLPFSLMFTALQNHGGTVAVANALMAIFLVILLTDWRNTVVVLVIGMSLGVVAYITLAPNPVWPKDFVERAPLVFFIGWASSLIKMALIETTEERMAEKLDQINKLEQAQREARVAALQETIGFLAHELNTPLGAVRLLADSASEMYVEKAQTNAPYEDTFAVAHPGEMVTLLEHISKRAHYSQELVKRLMRSAYHVRYDGGPQALTATSLVQSLLENYPFPDDIGPDSVDVAEEADFVLAGSRELLYLVLSTLTQNSLLALRGNPTPRLRIEIVGNSGGQHGGVIRVTDNGCGVPPEVLSKLTKSAVPSSWKSGQGGGMGLVFAQRVMDANGGSVTVNSEPGKGTTVTLTFRAEPSITPQPTAPLAGQIQHSPIFDS